MLVIQEVNTQALEQIFVNLVARIYAGNPHYIRPLNKEVLELFDVTKNKHLKKGTAQKWLVLNEEQIAIGRIAAFVNPKYITKGTEYPTGGIGLFECVNNQEAANLLFNTAKEWLIKHKVEAMDGPINPGDRDKWWGLMVEGFEAEPVYGMSFNPSYYQALFENYGFKNYYNQYFYTMQVHDPLPEKIRERHAKFKAKADYSARHLTKNKLAKYAQDFATVYNAAWAQHGEGKEITAEQVLKLFNSMKPIMDEKTVWFAYYKEEPIAMFINIPDINQYFKYFNGQLGLWQKIRLMWMKYRGECKKLTGLAFGVVPKFQALGIDSFIIGEVSNFIPYHCQYTAYEMGWAGDWNPKMVNIYKNLGGKQSRRMITYRYIFDENKHPFERHPLMDYKQ